MIETQAIELASARHTGAQLAWAAAEKKRKHYYAKFTR